MGVGVATISEMGFYSTVERPDYEGRSSLSIRKPAESGRDKRTNTKA